jgi:hypothetical protein
MSCPMWWSACGSIACRRTPLHCGADTCGCRRVNVGGCSLDFITSCCGVRLPTRLSSNTRFWHEQASGLHTCKAAKRIRFATKQAPAEAGKQTQHHYFGMLQIHRCNHSQGIICFIQSAHAVSAQLVVCNRAQIPHALRSGYVSTRVYRSGYVSTRVVRAIANRPNIDVTAQAKPTSCCQCDHAVAPRAALGLALTVFFTTQPFPKRQ